VDSFCIISLGVTGLASLGATDLTLLGATGLKPSAMSKLDNAATVRDRALVSDLPLSLRLVGGNSLCKPLDCENQVYHSDTVTSLPHEYRHINGG
jgi:hypothetical protein